MPIPRKIGTIVFGGVPAIIGGGIVYAVFGHSVAAVAAYELTLFLVAGAFLSK